MGNTNFAANFGHEDVAVRENALVGAAGVVASGDVDLRHNWWGDASGPSGDSGGTGVPLYASQATGAGHAPWLSAPPDLSVDCEEGLATWRS